VTDQLEELRERLASFARDRDWDQFHSPKNLSMALIAEAAELVEHFQWLSEEDSRNLSAEKHEAIAMELADIFIFLIRVADKLDVDLTKTTWKKIELNETRYPVSIVKGSAKRASEY
jgi:NTP pyrophosphatase (non-canonical NTP hydrolase)